MPSEQVSQASHGPPQSTSDSPWFFRPSEHVGIYVQDCASAGFDESSPQLLRSVHDLVCMPDTGHGSGCHAVQDHSELHAGGGVVIEQLCDSDGLLYDVPQSLVSMQVLVWCPPLQPDQLVQAQFSVQKYSIAPEFLTPEILYLPLYSQHLYPD